MPFFVYRLAGTSSVKAATDWGRKAPSAAFCTHAQAGQCHEDDMLGYAISLCEGRSQNGVGK